MKPSILFVAPHARTFLGLAQAMLRFGYQMTTAFPEEADLASLETPQPSLVVVQPPSEPHAKRCCLQLIKARFLDRGVPVVAWVLTQAEQQDVQQYLNETPVVIGNPLRLKELYDRIQELLDLAGRRALRIATDLVVAHRRADRHRENHYSNDTMSALSVGGCFIRTQEPYPIESVIEVILRLGSSSQILKIAGRVRYHGAEDRGREQGMGVMFENLSERDCSTLESFLMSQLGTVEFPSNP